jgi:multiple sugar transport system permease protein
MENWARTRELTVATADGEARIVPPAGLSILRGAYSTNYGVIMAGVVVASVPVIILFIAVQRQIVESVARSGLKG